MSKIPTARLVTSVTAAFLLSLMVPTVAADNVNNDVTVGVSDSPLVGVWTTVKYFIIGPPSASDGQAGCNAADASPMTLTINAPAAVEKSASSVTFTACGNTVAAAKTVQYRSLTAGDYPITVSISDSGAGSYNNNAGFTLHVLAPPDTGLPSIVAHVAPAAASSGWHNIATGPPTVSFTCSDAISAIQSCSSPVTLGQGANQTVVGQASDTAGNQNSTQVELDVDLTLPSIIAHVSPDPASSDWHNLDTGAPTVSFECADALSGIASCSANVTLGEGADQEVEGTAVDRAGNTRSIEVVLDVDLTAPSINADLTPSGWYNVSTGGPTVSFSCSDALSGLASCPASVLLDEGADQAIDGTAYDVAGNSNSTQSGPFDVDLTPPSIVGSLSPAPAGSGWYNLATGAPTASFDCSDELSGVASCTDPVLLDEGEDQSADGTAYDNAGNQNSTSTEPADVDLTPPSIVASLSPAPAGSGWYNNATGAPTASFECSDELSGVASCTDPIVLGEGEDQTADGSAVDVAGNENSTSSSPADIDLSAPSIVAHVSHDAGSSGWYNLSSGAPTISFECADALSGIASCSANVTLGEGANQTVQGVAVDVAGNNVSIEVGPFDVDLTPPSIIADLSPAGWYNASTGPPTVSFSCSDLLSGLASCPAGVLLDEGEDQTIDGTAYDVAGNSNSTQSGPFDVDLTAPSIVGSLSPGPAGSGWYNLATGAPTASFDCDDDLSGIASCTDPIVLGEGINQTADGTAVDVAGNQNSTSTEPVDIDLTAPTIVASLSPAPAGNGWYNLTTGAPTASFDCHDALSGIASCSANVTLGEGLAQSQTGFAMDVAGNEANATAGPADVDLTAPVLSLPANFTVLATGVGGGPASFNVSASDNLDSAPDITCSAVSGALFAPGATIVTCSATDEAGNSASGSFKVTVRYSAVGFLQPVQSNEMNVAKAGSTVPLKFILRTASGGQIGDLAAVSSFAVQSIVCNPLLPDPVPFLMTGGTSLRYDPIAGQFIQNWKTPSAKGCVQVSVTLADGQVLSAPFQLK